MPPPKVVCPGCGVPTAPAEPCNARTSSGRCGAVPGGGAKQARDVNGLLIPSDTLPRMDEATDEQIGWVRNKGAHHNERSAYTAVQESQETWERAYTGRPARRHEQALRVLSG